MRSTTTEATPTGVGRRESKLRVTDVLSADGTREVSVRDDNQKVLASMLITSSGHHMTLDVFCVPLATNSSRFYQAVVEMFTSIVDDGGNF